MYKFNMKRASALFLVLFQISGCFCVSINAISNKDKENPVEIKSNEELQSPRALVESCEGLFNPVCLKLKFISLIDGFSSSQYIIYPGINLVKDRNEDKEMAMNELEEISRSFPEEPEKRVDSYLMYKIGSFIETHSIKFKFIGDETARGLLDEYEDDEDVDDDVDEYIEDKDGRRIHKRRRGGKKKKKKIVAAILGVVALLKGFFGIISTGAIFLLAKKALLASVAAILISGALAIKTFITDKEKSEEIGPAKHGGGHSGGHQGGHQGGHDDYYPYSRSIEFKLPAHLSSEQS